MEVNYLLNTLFMLMRIEGDRGLAFFRREETNPSTKLYENLHDAMEVQTVKDASFGRSF